MYGYCSLRGPSWSMGPRASKTESPWSSPDESRVAMVLLSLSRIWHRVKSIPSHPSGLVCCVRRHCDRSSFGRSTSKRGGRSSQDCSVLHACEAKRRPGPLRLAARSCLRRARRSPLGQYSWRSRTGIYAKELPRSRVLRPPDDELLTGLMTIS